MLPKNCKNEWLTSRGSVKDVLNFIKEKFYLALDEQKSNVSDRSLGSRMNDSMTVFCNFLELRGMISEHVIMWGDTWMCVQFIRCDEGSYSIEFDLEDEELDIN